MTVQNILVIGAGELGTQVLLALAQHRHLTSNSTISALLRPSTISSANSQKMKELEVLRAHGIVFVPGDITHDAIETLSSIFEKYDTIISCTGFASGPGTQIKLTKAILAANVPRYIPWQFGVDYDIIGRGSAQDLFDEQLDVRDLLRAQKQTKWVIISTGMFTSFLFEPSFGVVDFEKSSVTALGGLENRVTVTGPVDIGRITAEVVLGDTVDEVFTDRAVYVAGDTLSYGRLAQLLEGVTGRRFERKVRTVEAAREDLAKEPGNGLYKYQIVFGEAKGIAWDVEETWNYKLGIRAQTAEEWARENLA
ncbi:hypothetical protein BDW62DRAFT_186911 [Aspergillus aurantiobrunneus]